MALRQMFFITGFPRSGTTLVERVLANQEGFFVAHQLFPTLFINVKKEFLRQNRNSRSYPFIPDSTDAEQKAFLDFLKNTRFTSSQVNSWMKEGLDYKAMGEKQVLNDVPHAEGKLVEVLRIYLEGLASDSDTHLGFKDVMMDDFIPYFESEGVSSIVVLRDPRAMILSLIHSQEMGGYRPTLYNLQVWKRGLRNAQNFSAYLLKYEELIQDFDAEIKKIGKYLNVRLKSDVFPLRKNNGEIWTSNSSFEGVSKLSSESLNSFKEKLSTSAISYIERICFDEMKDLGYNVFTEEIQKIEPQKEPFKVTHHAFDKWDNEKELRIELSK